MNLSKKNTYVFLYIIIFLSLIINLISFKNGHGWGDSWLDIQQARTIVEGKYDELFSIHRYRFENSTANAGPYLYPWGFPILLSPVYYFFGLDIHVMKVYVSLFFFLSLIFVFLLFKDSLSNFDNLLLISIIAFDKWFFDFKDWVSPDIPFFFLSTLSLFLIKRFIIQKDIWINRLVSYSLIGISMFSSFYVRSVGIFLLPTLLIVQYIDSRSTSKNFKTFIFSDISKFIPYVIFFIFIIAVNLTVLSINIIERTLYEFSIYYFKATIIFNIRYYFFVFSGFLFNPRSSAVHFAIHSIIIASAIFGMIRNWKKDYMYIIYGLITLSFLMFYQGRAQRLVIYLYPFFLYFLFIGLSKMNIYFELTKKYKPFEFNAARLFGIGLVIISLAYILNATYQNINFNKTKIIDGPYTSDSVELFNYIKQNTKKDDTIVFFDPMTLPLFTGRKSIGLNPFNYKQDLINSPAQYIAYYKVSHVPNSDLTIQDLRDNYRCPFENNTFIFCNLNKNSYL